MNFQDWTSKYSHYETAALTEFGREMARKTSCRETCLIVSRASGSQLKLFKAGNKIKLCSDRSLSAFIPTDNLTDRKDAAWARHGK